jgi:hypothetical protein
MAASTSADEEDASMLTPAQAARPTPRAGVQPQPQAEPLTPTPATLALGSGSLATVALGIPATAAAVAYHRSTAQFVSREGSTKQSPYDDMYAMLAEDVARRSVKSQVPSCQLNLSRLFQRNTYSYL